MKTLFTVMVIVLFSMLTGCASSPKQTPVQYIPVGIPVYVQAPTVYIPPPPRTRVVYPQGGYYYGQ